MGEKSSSEESIIDELGASEAEVGVLEHLLWLLPGDPCSHLFHISGAFCPFTTQL